jgi:MoaA/NifB/PqqE/SkfB family radical SAM enzyme
MAVFDAQPPSLARATPLRNASTADTVVCHGDGMSPFLRDGDVLRVEPVNYDEIVVGDLITFRVTEHCPTLRVLRKGTNKLTLGADHWHARKFVTWREFVTGRVVARTRRGKTLEANAPAWKLYSAAQLSQYYARKIPSRVQRLYKPSALTYARPLNVQLNLSATCNLKCRMCPYLEVHTSERLKFMARETFEAMLPTLRAIRRVHFSGSGEPLFHREAFDLIARVRQEIPDCEIDLTTNGTLLTRERAARLLDLRVNKLHVSFDGLPGRVETIRRNVNGAKVLDNLSALAEMKRERGAKAPSIQINYMTGYGTYHDLVEFIERAHAIGINEIQLLEMQPATAADFEHNLLNDSQRDQAYALKTAIMLANHYDLCLHLPIISANACHFPSNPHIAEDGEVYPCCYLDYDGRKLYADGQPHVFPSLSFGNIHQTPMQEIWDAPQYAAFRARNARGDFDRICRACYHSRRQTSDFLRELMEAPQ